MFPSNEHGEPMSYEDQLIREATEGPQYWCSACERDADDCICDEILEAEGENEQRIT